MPARTPPVAAPPARAAAVLVGLWPGPAGGVLLTRRSDTLRDHAGQVAFPGGGIDPADRDATAAALREAWEEVALPPDRVEPLGRLPDHVTVTGFHLTPVVGLIDGEPLLAPSVDEVAAIFLLGWSVLLDPAGPRRRRLRFEDTWRDVMVWPHPQHLVWGATAAILHGLAARLVPAGD